MNPLPWTTGLFDCTEDCSSCWLTCCCPWIAFGRIAEIVDEGSPTCCHSGLLFCFHKFNRIGMVYRKKLRTKFNLEESPSADSIVDMCWGGCALCQEYRELKNRGFDPALGWAGNMEKQKSGQAWTVTAPPVGQSMVNDNKSSMTV